MDPHITLIYKPSTRQLSHFWVYYFYSLAQQRKSVGQCQDKQGFTGSFCPLPNYLHSPIDLHTHTHGWLMDWHLVITTPALGVNGGCFFAGRSNEVHDWAWMVILADLTLPVKQDRYERVYFTQLDFPVTANASEVKVAFLRVMQIWFCITAHSSYIRCLSIHKGDRYLN